MTKEQEAIAKKIFETINRQNFADWYNRGRFDDYITCEIGAPTKEQLLQDIVDLFRL